MLGGFTFKGIHSSVYGVRETPSSQVLSPQKRRNLISIPGRSSAFIQEDGGYEERKMSIICSYAKPYGVNIYEQVRQIAWWLDGVGDLIFDYEPTLRYKAFVSSPPPTVIMLEFAQFTLDFTITHPFAYELAVQQNENIVLGAPLDLINVTTGGTVKTPVRLIITNNTDQVITELLILNKYIKI